ncbi:MAG: diguanylate cyclase (GGDEF)-like protein [Motiliproteus sp.]|jgi:diguanylate cyclase (GGDEF)-like protein
MGLRLGAKFILLVVGILSITLAANTLQFLRSQNSLLEEQLVEQGKALGHFVALVSPTAILGYDFLLLNEYAREISHRRDVVYGVVVDPEGRPLTNFINRDDPLLSSLISIDAPVKISELLLQLQAIDEVIALEFNIVHDAEVLGSFRMGLSRIRLSQQIRQQLWIQSGTYGLIILFLSGAIYLVFRFNVLFPVRRLIQASGRIEKGEYPQVKVRSQDEMGVLTHAFNSMVGGIRQERAKLHHQANYDVLTGLPNRMMAIEQLRYEISRSRRVQQRLAVLFIDLDDFKVVNDTLGHATGDQLLVEIGVRLKSELRDTDMIARLGGDEFLLLLPLTGGESEVDQITSRLITAVSEPMRLKSREVKPHCSIGVALFPFDGETADLLMANADNAMYQAKAKALPSSSVCFFTAAMNERVQERLQMELDLNLALDRSELQLYFQPLIDAKTGCHSGAEVLLRWLHPQKGMISPAVFIPVAETTGQIVAIGEWVIREAAQQWSLWHQSGITCEHLAINVSRVQFGDRLSLVLGEVVAKYRLPPGVLQLEVTEGVLLDDHETVSSALNQFHALGIKLAMDDFGTGYSSLSYLKRFRFDILKIDQSFVSGLPDNREDVSLVKAIVVMAHSMDLKVVAEGVETQAQHNFLCGIGCDYSQGYLFARPMPCPDYTNYLQNTKSFGEGGASAPARRAHSVGD